MCGYDNDKNACFSCPYADCIRDDIEYDDAVLGDESYMTVFEEIQQRCEDWRSLTADEYKREERLVYWKRRYDKKMQDEEWHKRRLEINRAAGQRYRDNESEEKRSKRLQYQREYYKRNKEKRILQVTEYNKLHKDKISEYKKEWRERNKER